MPGRYGPSAAPRAPAPAIPPRIGRIVNFVVLVSGSGGVFYWKIIKGGGGIAPRVLPLMLCPGVSAIITKLIFDRSLKGLGWKPGPAKRRAWAYLPPILHGATLYGLSWLVGRGGFTTDAIAEVASELGMST